MPASHNVHADDVVAPITVEYVAAGHNMHGCTAFSVFTEFKYFPGEHRSHLLLPISEYVPFVHARQDIGDDAPIEV